MAVVTETIRQPTAHTAPIVEPLPKIEMSVHPPDTSTTPCSLASTNLASPGATTAHSSPPAFRVLTTADYKAAAACLAAAFKDDPVCTYGLDSADAAGWSPDERWALHLRTFECAVYAHILAGVAIGVPSSRPASKVPEPKAASSWWWSASPSTEVSPCEFDAVALWMPPGRNMDDWLTLFRSGLWRLKWAFTREGRARFYDEFLPLLNATKAEVLGDRDQESWYLVYLATREEARGRGLARLLIRYGTEKADAAGLATYLESSHKGNVGFYERLGFVTKRTVSLRHGEGVEMDIMVREAGAARV